MNVKWSFKSTLFIVIIIFAVLPVIIDVMIVTGISSNAILNFRKASLHKMALTNGVALDEIINGQMREVQLMAIAELPKNVIKNSYVTTRSEQEVEAELNKTIKWLKRWVNSNEFYNDAIVVNADGIIIASINRDFIGLDVKSEEFFSKANITENTVVSNVKKSTLHNQQVIEMSHSIDMENERDGVLVLFTSPNFFKNFIREMAYSETVIGYIIDENNHIIFHSNSAEKLKPSKSLLELQEKLEANEIQSDGLYEYVMDGEKRITGYYYLDTLGWVIGVRQGFSEIIRSSYQISYVSLIILVITIITSVIAGKIITNGFIKPINKLNEAFSSAAATERYIYCEIEGTNEFAVLASNYNRMVQYLEQNYEEITATEEELRDNYKLLKDEQEKNEFIAYHDVTTGLLNRVALEIELEKLLKNKTSGSVLFVDLDNFKYVNDVFGHDYGDCLLAEIGERLVELKFQREHIARIGGDEFIVLKIAERFEVEKSAEQILELFKQPFIINQMNIYVSASIGIAQFDEYSTIDESGNIIKNADIAMYKAKSEGKNAYRFYNEDMKNELIRYNKVVEILRTAIEEEEVFLLYQPEVDLRTNKIVAFESLMRVNSKKLGFLSPAEFIPIAETSGVIIKLSEWLIESACRFAKQLLDSGREFGVISVNISAVHFLKKDFVKDILDIINMVGIEPRYIQLEITESMLMTSIDTNIKILNEIKATGMSIALDDFGTGYSSLSYLMKLPIHVVKIDKSFVDDICEDPKKQVICETIIEMAHTLGLKVVVEGIEEEEQRDLLMQIETDIYQGYYFSRPVDKKTVMELLDRN